MNCPDCKEQIPETAKICGCGWRKTENRFKSKTSWINCNWKTDGRRCQVAATIFATTFGELKHGKCTWHHLNQSDPKIADDDRAIDSFLVYMQKRYQACIWLPKFETTIKKMLRGLEMEYVVRDFFESTCNLPVYTIEHD